MKQVTVFREILAHTPVNQFEVQERTVVLFRVSENTWLEAIVRCLVHPKEAGRVKRPSSTNSSTASTPNLTT